MRSLHLALPLLVSLSSYFDSASAHTYVWSVWVNGVDQGSGNGIRLPAYNGPMAPINAGYVPHLSRLVVTLTMCILS